MIQKPDAIFLDWDGTLVDSFAFLLAAHNHVRGIIGREPFSAKQFEEYFGQPRETLYTNLYGEHRTEAKKHFEEFVIKHHLNYLKPMPGAEELMHVITDMKIPAGVVSNKKGDFIRKEIDNFGWTPMFASIVGAGEAPQDKPAADPLLLAMRLAGIRENPSNIWYVGDSETDAGCAKNAGCKLVIIDNTNMDGAWMAQYKPVLTVKNCQELADFLLQWRGN